MQERERVLVARLAAGRRWDAGSPETAELARLVAVAKAERMITRAMAAAPVLTVDERERLAELVAGAGL